MRAVYLSTKDNPYNPAKDFDRWFQFDFEKRYGTMEMLATFAQTSPDLSDADNAAEIERAVDEIVKCDPFKRFIKVVEEV